MRPRWLTPVLLMSACFTRADREPSSAPHEPPLRTVAEAPADDPITSIKMTDGQPAEADPHAIPDPDPAQREAWLARAPKSVVENQPWRTTTTVDVHGDRRGTATLIDLAPNIGVWYLLSVAWEDGTGDTWHLENPSGRAQSIALDPRGLSLRGVVCELFGGQLEAARLSGQAYGPVCDGLIAVRNPTEGHKTRLEWTTDFLRDHVWGGDQITNMVKETLYADSQLATSELGAGVGAPSEAGAPRSARVAEVDISRRIDPVDLGLSVTGPMAVGAWYPFEPVDGAWVSLIQAGRVHPDILDSPRVRDLGAAEAGAMVYTVAFDLSKFDLGYEVGSDHPRVNWSYKARDGRDGLPGPDGYATIEPLVRIGLMDPAFLPREVAVFVGGFKREHGAFGSGPLSRQNSGSHYGFMEFGTELSRLQPGLATLLVDADGRVDVRTWTEADSTWSVRHARQNGVPLVEPDENGVPQAGTYVRDWSEGNWSGSAEGGLRTVRSGVCLQESEQGRFLLYSYFSGVTPSAMADVFLSYDCRYAMELDINALEHTYLALRGDDDRSEHLVKGMEAVDQRYGKRHFQRFIGVADNRDFFYVLRKPQAPPGR